MLAFSLGIFALRQPYPIYDDWSYGWSVKHLLETGKLEYLATFATAMPMIFAGAVAAKIFGFSFELLHALTAFFNIVSALGMYYAIRLWTKNVLLACIAASTLLFNPILVNISFAFMTDTVALACSTWSFWSLSKILKKQSNALIIALFLLISFLGILTRQSFIAFCPLLVVAGIASYRTNKVASIVLFSGILLQVFLLFGADSYLKSHMQFPADYLRLKFAFTNVMQGWLQKPSTLVFDAWTTTAKIMTYLGPFSFPLIVWKLPQILQATWSTENTIGALSKRSASWTSLLIALLFVAAPLTFISCFCGDWMPYFHAFWDFPRVGSYTWITNESVRTEAMTQYWTFACTFIGTLSFWVSSYSVADLMGMAKTSKNKDVILFLSALLSCVIVMLAFAFIQENSVNYDRYLIPFLVPLMLVTCMDPDAPAKKGSNEILGSVSDIATWQPARPAFISTLLLASYSFLAATDFVNFQNARWKAALHMEAKGARVDELDVGPDYIFFKVPAIYQYSSPETELPPFAKNPMTGPLPLGEVRRWPVLNEKYVLNPEFDESLFVGFRPIYRQPYWSPWYLQEKQILVMEKNPLSTEKYIRPAWVYDIIRPITHTGN